MVINNMIHYQLSSHITQSVKYLILNQQSTFFYLVVAIAIPAAFFDRFFLWSFWSSSTLPWLVCLAYVHGFYFLFCCVEVSSVVLCLLCYVALCCNPSGCVALRSVAIHCVVSVLFCFVVLRSVVSLLCCIHWVALHCDLLCCVALCCVALLTSSAFLVFRLC